MPLAETLRSPCRNLALQLTEAFLTADDGVLWYRRTGSPEPVVEPSSSRSGQVGQSDAPPSCCKKK
jgi:hypothetical protein